MTALTLNQTENSTDGNIAIVAGWNLINKNKRFINCNFIVVIW
jgi:hypothetical protein